LRGEGSKTVQKGGQSVSTSGGFQKSRGDENVGELSSAALKVWFVGRRGGKSREA